MEGRIVALLLVLAAVGTHADPKARPIPTPTPKSMALDLFHPGQLDEHRPNYCNQSELAAEAGLLHSPLGQFLGFPCSNEFFHCRWQSDGYRTYRKNCRPGLVYDTLGTQNCNYDHNVKGCGMQGGALEKASCKESDFTCPLSGTCVKMGQRCDGKYDCALEEDEQNCPMCRPNEFPCVISEECIPISQRCSGVAECQDNTDERDCGDCGAGKWYCRKSGKCLEAERRCNGVADCPHGEDELLCKKSPPQLPPIPFTPLLGRLCGNGSGAGSAQLLPPMMNAKSTAYFPRVEFTATTTAVTPPSTIKPRVKTKARVLVRQSSRPPPVTTTSSPPPPPPPPPPAQHSPILDEFEVEGPPMDEEVGREQHPSLISPPPPQQQSLEVNEMTEPAPMLTPQGEEEVVEEQPHVAAAAAVPSNLLARGAAIPLSKYPLVNPWKASVASGAFMRKGSEATTTAAIEDMAAEEVPVEATKVMGVLEGNAASGGGHPSQQAQPSHSGAAPKSAEERQILRRLSDKYGTSTRDLLRKIEQLLQADENLHRTAVTSNTTSTATADAPPPCSIPLDSHGVTQPPLQRVEEEKRIRVTRRPTLRKWRPAVSAVGAVGMAQQSEAPSIPKGSKKHRSSKRERDKE